MLAQLKSKILDLQSQIQATQTQITDYQTNPAYVDFYYYCPICRINIGKNSICHNNHKHKRFLPLMSFPPKITQFFTKTTELAQARAQLTALQNELKATQAQYEQAKEQYKACAMILKQAFVSPPPSKNLSSQKVLKSIESMQGFLKQIQKKSLSRL